MRPVRFCSAVLPLSAMLGAGFAAQQPLENKVQSEHVEVYSDAEAYKVYAAALPIDSWYWEGSSTMLIVREIPPREWTGGGPREVLGGEPGLLTAELEPVLASFEEANKEPRLLNSDIDLHRSHRFIRTADLNAAFKLGDEEKNHDIWQGFRQEFPGTAGYLMLSAVGFNPEKTLALVYIEHRCGSGCGGTHYFVLQKRHEIWVRYFPPNQASATSKP